MVPRGAGGGAGLARTSRYLFRDGRGPAGEQPPNDWQSGFGGPAWHRVGDGQWYFHYFAKEQPDLNWNNPEVRADFRTTLRFWADRGVDGFRVDVAHGLVKDMSEPYRPWAEISEMMVFSDGSHPLWDRDEVHQVYADWRRVFAEYDPPRFAVAEACVHPSRRARYASADSLGQAFNFEMQDADWRATDFRRVIDSGLADMRAERIHHDLAARLPRQSPGRDPLRPAARRRPPRAAGGAGLAADRRTRAASSTGSG